MESSQVKEDAFEDQIFEDEEFSPSIMDDYNNIYEAENEQDCQLSQIPEEESYFIELENQDNQDPNNKNSDYFPYLQHKSQVTEVNLEDSEDSDEYQQNLTNAQITCQWQQWIRTVSELPQPRKETNRYLIRKKREFRTNPKKFKRQTSVKNQDDEMEHKNLNIPVQQEEFTKQDKKTMQQKKKYQKYIDYPEKSEFLEDQSTVKSQNIVESKIQSGRRKKKDPYKSMTLRQLKELERMFSSKSYTVSEIAQCFDMSTNTVYRYLKKFTDSNGNLVKHCLTLPGRITRCRKPTKQKHEKTKLAILEVIKKNPKIYQSEIASDLKHRYHMDVSQSTVSRLMKTINLVKKKPQKIFIDTNTGSNIQKRFLYCKLYRTLDKDKLIFLDESHINNRINREKGWVIKGTNFHCEQLADGGNKYSVLMAITYEKMLEHTIKFGSLNSEDMVQFIEEQIQNKYPGFTLILDNHRIHKTPQVKEALDKYNIKHIYLPPYTPLLNPIQNVFHELKSFIRTLRSENPDETLQKLIHKAVEEISTRSFEKYKDYVEKWVEKGLKKQKFFKTSDKSETSSVNMSSC